MRDSLMSQFVNPLYASILQQLDLSALSSVLAFLDRVGGAHEPTFPKVSLLSVMPCTAAA